MRKVLLTVALAMAFMVSPILADAHPAACMPVVADPAIIGGGGPSTVAVAGFGAGMVLIALAPAIIQTDNPLCGWFTCYDADDRPFVTDAYGTHPID